ncbi:transposase [Pasteuria penetrans]|nr:transposase [Pasteuria penetrans]
MKTVRKKFSLEFKQKAVEQVKNEQHIAQVSRQCGQHPVGGVNF